MHSEVEQIVYLVDDDADVREGVSALLQSVGLKVVALSSTVEFLAHKGSEEPSCLILDVRLPGLSGLDFQTELAKTQNDIPIIFITGHGDIPMTVKAMKAGAVEFLTKPFRDQDLLDAVRFALERDRARRELQIQIAIAAISVRFTQRPRAAGHELGVCWLDE